MTVIPVGQSWHALEALARQLKEKVEEVFCPHCMKYVKPDIRLIPTFLDSILIEKLCPHCRTVLSTEYTQVRLPDRKPHLIKGGTYIAFEGIDGSGKTYYSKWLVEELKRRDYDVIYVKEPWVDAIKEFLYKHRIDPDAEVYIFAADRIILQTEEILPALEQNKIVVSDRSIFSSIAYQSARGVSEAFIWGVNRSIKVPEFVIILDVPVDVALKRIEGIGRAMTRFEDPEFLERVRRKFLEIAERYANISRFVVVDNSRPEEVVKKEILDHVLRYLEEKEKMAK